eukprot:11213971-Lingulodinium_polyedra.AAC.1
MEAPQRWPVCCTRRADDGNTSGLLSTRSLPLRSPAANSRCTQWMDCWVAPLLMGRSRHSCYCERLIGTLPSTGA